MRILLTGLALVIALPVPSLAGPDVAPPAKYEAAVRELETFLTREIAQKEIPALSIALVDGQQIVWARGFGHADRAHKLPATADTVYRVGSVSKLFTDLAVMQLVEQGKLDLDAPVTRYLPEFKPPSSFNKPITLRQLMAHRSGLLREPPVGNYFDTTNPSLEKTVASLNGAPLVYEPGTHTHYSNAGIAVVGLVLQETQKEQFASYLRRTLLLPLGMKRSAFEPVPELATDLAAATMWTYHGRTFEAPRFALGMAPAGSLYTTVLDLGRFESFLFASGPVLKKETLEAMWKPQFAKPDESTGFGLGFRIDKLDGHRRIGHGGAIYGFSTELAVLPEEKLGVVVVSARDVSNGFTTRVANLALREMLAVRAGNPPRHLESTEPVDPAQARALAGRYRFSGAAFDLNEYAGRLWLLEKKGGNRLEVRSFHKSLMVDDVLGYGLVLRPEGNRLFTGESDGGIDYPFLGGSAPGRAFDREVVDKPEPAPERWRGLIGEYGWDHNTLYILEKDGKLQALIEWAFLYSLEELSENEYRFPNYGLYEGERLYFTRKEGKGTQVEVSKGGGIFPRRHLDGEDGQTFSIKAERPLDVLRKEALAAKPPDEKGAFRRSDLVDLTTLDATIKLDIRYATTNNFLSTPFYTSAKAFMQRPAAEAVVRAHKKLAEQGYGLLLHDCYRPWSVTKMFWDATPEKFHDFVADPSKGSRHNRGCAVDLTLYDLKTGKPIEMVGGYDEFSDRSYPEYPGGTSLQRWHRLLLRHAMEAEGFTVYEAEWWHFDYRDWKQYRINNVTFEEMASGR